jgi:hypothetical protein
MRTVKVKKEIHRSYSFENAVDHWSHDDRNYLEQLLEEFLGDYDDVEGPFSDIVETIYYAEVEEQVPHVGEKWLLWRGEENGDATLMLYPTEEGAIEARDFWIAKGRVVSKIEHMRKEF